MSLIGFVWVAPEKDPFGGAESLIIFLFRNGCALASLPTMPPSQDRADSPSLADDLDRRLDLDDFSIVQPSIVSSLAQSSARGGTARRGEFSGAMPVASTPHLSGGVTSGGALRQVQSAPGKLPASLSKVVYIKPTDVRTLCLGYVGASKGGIHARFCIARKLRGQNHCGTSSHAKSKMTVSGSTFWLPGGTILDKATAKTSPCLKEADLSEDDVEYLKAINAPPQRWPEHFQRIQERINRRRNRDVRGSSPAVAVEEVDELSREDEEDDAANEELEDLLAALKRQSGDHGDGTGRPVVWPAGDDSEEEEEDDDTVDLRTLVANLKRTVERQAEAIAELTTRVDEDRDTRALETLRAETNDLLDNLGDLFGLVQEHGSVSQAISAIGTKQEHSEAELTSLATDIMNLSLATSGFASKLKMSENKVVALIDKLAARSDKHVKLVLRRVEALEQTGPPPPPLHLPTTFGLGSAGISAPRGAVGMDTVFGTETIGSTAVDITMNYIYSTLRSMTQTVGELATRYQNSGIIYGGHSFPSAEDFGRWYMAHNPRGNGLAAFADFVSIWAFVGVSTETSVEWLSSVEKSAKLGLGSQDTAYVHTMSHKYPPRIAGKGVSVILSTECLKMLKSFEEWRGTSEGMSMGDGTRERILTDIRGAVANHRQYCLDTLPDSPLRDLAIQTGEDTGLFYQNLFNYVDQELHNLTTINIKTEHILLLLSNQLVRMCDDMHAVRSSGSSVRLDNLPAAATRLAWVSLQAVMCMESYSKARFRDHPGVSSAYLRFLTCRVAAHADLGLKETLDTLSRKVTAVERVAKDAATKEALGKLDNKVESLKNARAGGGGAGGGPRT